MVTSNPTTSFCCGNMETHYLELKFLLSCLGKENIWKVGKKGWWTKVDCNFQEIKASLLCFKARKRICSKLVLVLTEGYFMDIWKNKDAFVFDVSDITIMFKCSCSVQLPIPEINSLKITKLAGAHFLDIFFVSGIVDIGIWKQAPAPHACWLLGLLMTSVGKEENGDCHCTIQTICHYDWNSTMQCKYLSSKILAPQILLCWTNYAKKTATTKKVSWPHIWQ